MTFLFLIFSSSKRMKGTHHAKSILHAAGRVARHVGGAVVSHVAQRMASKRKSSHTKTKRGKSKQQEVDDHYGASHSSVYVKGRKKSLSGKMVDALSPIQTFYYSGASQVTTSSYGIQNVWNVCTVLPSSLVNQLFTDARGMLTATIGQNNTGGAADDLKLYLECATFVTMYTNNTLTTIEMDIYDIEFKRDVSTVPSILFNNGAVSRSNLNTIDNATVSGSTYGVSPYLSMDFKRFCKVTKTTRVLIPAGGFHKHTGKIVFNKWVPYAQYSASLDLYYKGISHHVMAVAKGFPVNTVGTGSVGATTAPPEIAYMEYWNVKYRAGTFQRSYYDTFAVLPQPTNTVTSKIVEQAASAIITAVMQA